MRAIIDLRDDQLEGLAEVCARNHLSRSEAVRKAIDQYVSAMKLPHPEKKPAFGLWKDRKLDAIDYMDELRKEWDR